MLKTISPIDNSINDKRTIESLRNIKNNLKLTKNSRIIWKNTI